MLPRVRTASKPEKNVTPSRKCTLLIDLGETNNQKCPTMAPDNPNPTKSNNTKKVSDKMSEIDDHIQKRFDIRRRLGKGAYGIVWKAVDKKSKRVVAIKKIFDAFRNQIDSQRTFREIMFLQAFSDHPNIIKLFSIHR